MNTAWLAELDRQTSGHVTAIGNGVDRSPPLYAQRSGAPPAAMVTVDGVQDVQAAVRAAARAQVPLTVRGGGHSGAGFATAEGGLMVDLSSLRGVLVHASRRTAGVSGGATWSDYDLAAQEHGLASTGGIVSSTGVAGLTLGGGIGALRGVRGLSVDNLRGAQVVLADGSITYADTGREPELFWALRGGGGNFGIVTHFDFSLYPVNQLTTGLLGWPLAEAHEVAGAYRAHADELPDHVVAELVFGHDARHQPTLMVVPRIIGDERAGAPLLDDLRQTGSLRLDTVRARSYREGQRFMDEMAGWGHRVYWSTITLAHLSDEVISVLADFTGRAPSPRSAVNVEHFHGEISRRPADETAVGFRHAPYNVFVEAKWDDPADDAVNRAWARDLIVALTPFAAGGGYVNYLPRDASESQIRAAYGNAKYERLRSIKADYDPANLLRTNQNIPPHDANSGVR